MYVKKPKSSRLAQKYSLKIWSKYILNNAKKKQYLERDNEGVYVWMVQNLKINLIQPVML